MKSYLEQKKCCYELRLSFHLRSVCDKLTKSVLLDLSFPIYKLFYSAVKKGKEMQKGGYYVKKKGENQKPSP